MWYSALSMGGVSSFSPGADEMVLNEIRAVRDGGGFGSIIGRNSFQRKKSDALWLLDTIMRIYAGAAA
jgi:class I fructose-bisphosphate aldolase